MFVDMSREPSQRTVKSDDATIQLAGGSGGLATAGTVNLNGASDSLFVYDNTTLDNATFNTSSYSTSSPYYDEGGPTFVVPATQRWTDTGIDVHAGDTITIDAYGTVRLSADPNDVADPLGSHLGRRAADAPLRDSPAGALVARIGNATILIGDHRTLTRYPFSGRLSLGVNDDHLNDNSGQYTASVNVEPYRR